MVPPMEELCECVTEWRDILFGKGLDVNATKSIVMVGRRAVVGYSESVCGVRMKGVHALSCVQDVNSTITRGVVVCVENYH